VLELSHSNGHKLHLCEYHIQCYWNFWPTFQTHWNDFQNELVADHISQTPGVARIGVTLSDGKTVGLRENG
jgi:hypothetical protein